MYAFYITTIEVIQKVSKQEFIVDEHQLMSCFSSHLKKYGQIKVLWKKTLMDKQDLRKYTAINKTAL